MHTDVEVRSSCVFRQSRLVSIYVPPLALTSAGTYQLPFESGTARDVGLDEWTYAMVNYITVRWHGQTEPESSRCHRMR